MSEQKQLDPHKTVLVFKCPDGVERGRKAATAENAGAWLDEMVSHYKGGSVDYIEDPDFALVSKLLSN